MQVKQELIQVYLFGEVKLTGFIHKIKGTVLNDTFETEKILDDVDMFPTSKNDEIKISFSCYGEKIEAIASIRWNIARCNNVSLKRYTDCRSRHDAEGKKSIARDER